MKEVVLVLSSDSAYVKRFCNQAIKNTGNKYLFLNFTSVNSVKEYLCDNKANSIVITDDFLEYIDDIKINQIYILNERDKKIIREGRKTYIYKLQNINSILGVIDKDFEKMKEGKSDVESGICKTVVFYTPSAIKNKMELLKKVAKTISKKKKVLILDIDEFENYKGNVGLSNIIFNYKENKLGAENIRKEIISIKEQDFIRSVTYPEDLSVITNIDLSNIINEIRQIGYDYIFINADSSYLKIEYILNDVDKLILIKDKDSDDINKFKKYILNEKKLDIKKIMELYIEKLDRVYMQAFAKQLIESE